MTDLLHLRCHRLSALHALVVGGVHRMTTDRYLGRNHLRRDIGLPEAPAPGAQVDLILPLVGLRRS